MTDQPASTSDTQPFVPAAPEPEPAMPAAAVTGDGSAPSSAVPTTPVRAGATRSSAARWVNVALAVAIAIAIGGIGFAAGRMTAPAAAAGAGGNGRVFANGQFPGGGYFRGGSGDGGFRGGLFGAGGATIQGTVDSVTGDTLTLKLADGQTIQLSLTPSTTYHSQAAATSSDVKTGSQVIIRLQLDRGQGTGPVSPSATDVTVVP